MRKQRGNALFLILLGIVLFGALTYAVSQGFRGHNPALSNTRTEALASDIIMTAAGVEKSVGKMVAKGVSENRISFNRSSGDGYELSPASTASEKVFNIAGGGAQYLDPPKAALDTTRSAESGYGSWLFSASNRFYNVPANGNNIVDLAMILPYVRKEICIAINNRMNIANPSGNPPVDSGNANMTTKYTGDYTGTAVNIADAGLYLGGKTAGCFEGTTDSVTSNSIVGRYYFYYVLMAR